MGKKISIKEFPKILERRDQFVIRFTMPSEANATESQYIRELGTATHEEDAPDIPEDTTWQLYEGLYEFKTGNQLGERTHMRKTEEGPGREGRPIVYIMYSADPVADNFRGTKVESGPPARPIYTIIAKSTDPVDLDDFGVADLVVVIGMESVAVDLLMYMRVTGVKSVIVPEGVLDRFQASERIHHGPTSFKAERPVIWRGTEENLYHLCLATTVPMIDKCISMLFSVYPHFRPYANANFATQPISDFEALTGQPLVTVDINTDPGKNLNLMMTLVTWTVSFGFTQQKNLHVQLASRARSIAAKVSTKAPTDGEFKGYLDKCGLKLTDLSAWFDEVMGQVICIGDCSEFDPNYRPQFDNQHRRINHNRMDHMGFNTAIRINDLMEYGEYNQLYYSPDDPIRAMEQWHWENLCQIRIVYENKHTSTVRFATAVIEHIRTIFTQLKEEWLTEIEKLEPLVGRLADHPYLGLVKTLPDTLQVGKVPRACVVGLLYFEDNLKTDIEKTKWQDYQVAAVKEKVKSESHLSICEAIAAGIPKDSLTAKAQLMKYVKLEECNRITSGLSEDDINSIYFYLQGQEAKGVWHAAEFKRRTNDFLNTLRETARTLLEKRFNRQRETVMDRINSLQDGPAKDAARVRVQDIRQQFETVLDLKTDFLALLPVRPEGTDAAKVQTTTDDLFGLWGRLDEFNFANLNNLNFAG